LNRIIDAHIHLDQYSEEEIANIQRDESIAALIAVSMDKASSIRNRQLSKNFSFVHPAFGFHPEQPLLKDRDFADLFEWIRLHQQDMIAIGEVGLPHYERQKDPQSYPLEPYLEVLEQFILLAKEVKKPIILHCIYDEAPLALELLEKHSFMEAHFHWFKGSETTLERMKTNGCYISFTPDIVYEEEIQRIAAQYPLQKIMAETDGPWPFEGPFHNHKTMPAMIHHTMEKLSKLKNMPAKQIYNQLLANTKAFYFNIE